jgi:glycosyltransferase involved in cell wall biosynthesis
LEDACFEGATIRHTARDPRALAGQADRLALPSADAAIFMHQIRPLGARRAVTLIHDTIPLRYGGSRVRRLLKRAFMRTVARTSAAILCPSQFARRQIERDLGVPAESVTVVRYPLDGEAAATVRRLRSPAQPPFVLYVGRFAAHKNVDRLVRAFARTQFAAAGGRLRLVGGSATEAARLGSRLEQERIGSVDPGGVVSEDERIRLLATCSALVQPSLEEGFGLPVLEALAAGIPVAASPTGVVPELPRDGLACFDPTDIESIAHALDTAAAAPPPPPLVWQSNFRTAVLDAAHVALHSEGQRSTPA